MNILFLTISRITDISNRGIYTDLMREFRDKGHEIFIATPAERRFKKNTKLYWNNGVTILRIKTLNIQKTNVIEKGLSTLLIEYQFLKAIKKNLSHVIFDLILYSTPPITFTKVVRYVKQKNKSLTYLLLKDIFPQNAVDIGLIKQGGMFHQYFRNKEKKLYAISDRIGCMSPANVKYIRNKNPQVKTEIVEVNPNSIEPTTSLIKTKDKLMIREKYKIPLNSIAFIYGGNIGKPQSIPFLIEVLNSSSINCNAYFVIAGSGTEYYKLKKWYNSKNPSNVTLLNQLDKNEFDLLIQCCDVGLIFLDRRFTIPNFPSRLLSYLEYKMPVVAATDVNTDIGSIIMENGFGLWAESKDIQHTINNINYFSERKLEIKRMGNLGYHYLLENYTVSSSYRTIMKHCVNKE